MRPCPGKSVDNCLVVHRHGLVNKKQQKGIETQLSHGAAEVILDKVNR